MPALTLPDIAESPSPVHPPIPPNPYPRPSSPRPPGVMYTHPHPDSGSGTPYHERLYSPPLSPHFTPFPPSSAMFSHFALPQAPPNWQPHISPFNHNPYAPPQPPQLVHKVWILDCRSCSTFLTNRGMKAVLLLRPNVSLFSTDALPVNCSAYSTNPDALRPPPCRPSIASSVPRTCECLTQTLCCHTCGAAVGYMIVIPCSRCTSSISATNRATNGHRFVFHSSEIIASERHYILEEPGVLPVEYPPPLPPPPPSSPPPLESAYLAVFHSDDATSHRQPDSPVLSQAFQQTSSPSPGPDYLPSLESPISVPPSAHSSPDLFSPLPPTSPRRSSRPLLQIPFPQNPAPQTLSETRGTTPELPSRKLKPGDVLYWHHLAKHGEIPSVEEDARARISNRGDMIKFLER